MCGRFVLEVNYEDILQQFDVLVPQDFSFKSYNIAPSQFAPIIYIDENHKKAFSMMQWGLLPSWFKYDSNSPRPINARIETIKEKPTFKSAYVKRRCLVPANGYYEWKKISSTKQPYYFHNEDNSLLAFAGLWESWEGEGSTVLSFTIITKAAEESFTHIHERMPYVLTKDNYNNWLFDSYLPDHCPQMDFYPVSLNVNSPINNEPWLIDRV